LRPQAVDGFDGRAGHNQDTVQRENTWDHKNRDCKRDMSIPCTDISRLVHVGFQHQNGLADMQIDVGSGAVRGCQLRGSTNPARYATISKPVSAIVEGCYQNWRMRVMTDNAATDLINNAVQASQNYNAKVMEFATANTRAVSEYLQKLQGAKSPSEAFELASKHVREQTEILTKQAKQLAEMVQKSLPKIP
jgi:hypothetical protein